MTRILRKKSNRTVVRASDSNCLIRLRRNIRVLRTPQSGSDNHFLKKWASEAKITGILFLFLILLYMGDSPTHVTSSTCMFADDCVIYRNITNDIDSRSLQEDLNVISYWCNVWLMELYIYKNVKA